MRKVRKPLLLIAAVILLPVLMAGCTVREVKKTFYTGGKIAYDSLTPSNRPSHP